MSRLIKDPIKTLMTIVSVCLAVASLITFNPVLGDYAFHLYCVGAGLAVFAVGSDSELLQTLLAVFCYVVSFYGFTFGWEKIVQSATKGGLLKDFLEWGERTFKWTFPFVCLAVSTFNFMTTFVSIRDDVTYAEAAGTVAGEIGSLVTGVVGGLADGVATGLWSSTTGKIALIGGAALLAYWLFFKDDDSLNATVVQPAGAYAH